MLIIKFHKKNFTLLISQETRARTADLQRFVCRRGFQGSAMNRVMSNDTETTTVEGDDGAAAADTASNSPLAKRSGILSKSTPFITQ
jgi:hypothetical protein